ncbi:MAG: hypothetical protein JWQ20_1345 [Conexibacter sp.]|nr:hypothetical protein [Conexibacter sp.]
MQGVAGGGDRHDMPSADQKRKQPEWEETHDEHDRPPGMEAPLEDCGAASGGRPINGLDEAGDGQINDVGRDDTRRRADVAAPVDGDAPRAPDAVGQHRDPLTARPGRSSRPPRQATGPAFTRLGLSGPAALDAGELVVVEEELEEVAGLGVAAELGAMHLVGPRAEAAVLWDPDEEVGVPDPVVVGDAGLVDHLAARRDRGQRSPFSLRGSALGREGSDVAPGRSELVDDRLLVSLPSLEQQGGVRRQRLGL